MDLEPNEVLVESTVPTVAKPAVLIKFLLE